MYKLLLHPQKNNLIMGDLPNELFVRNELFQEFYNYFPVVVKEIVTNPEYKDMPKINEWLEQSLRKTITEQNGKTLSGEFCVLTFQNFTKTTDFGRHKIKAFILGWCVKLLESGMCITENFVKATRQKANANDPSYLLNTGAHCFNDSLLIIGGMYHLLKTHFADDLIHKNLLNIFRDAQFKRTLGSSLIQQTSLEKAELMQNVDLQSYYAIVKNISEISFYVPVAAAMLMAGVSESNILSQTKTVCLNLALLRKLTIDSRNQISFTWDTSTLYESWTLFGVLQFGTSKNKSDFLDSFDDSGFLKRAHIVSKIISELKLYTILANKIEELIKEILEDIEKFPMERQKRLFQRLFDIVHSQ